MYFVKVGHTFTDFLKSELCNCLGHPRIAQRVGTEAGETKAVALVASVGSASGVNLSGSGIGMVAPWPQYVCKTLCWPELPHSACITRRRVGGT